MPNFFTKINMGSKIGRIGRQKIMEVLEQNGDFLLFYARVCKILNQAMFPYHENGNNFSKIAKSVTTAILKKAHTAACRSKYFWFSRKQWKRL